MTIELTEDEARVLINLLDLAVKAGGLQTAEAAVHFAKILQSTSTQEEVAK